MSNHRSGRLHGAHKPASHIPRWLRPKLTAQSLRDLGLAHWTNLDALAIGQGNPEIMWQIGGGLLTWWRVATTIRQGDQDMTEQIDLFDRVVSHSLATGRVEWPTPEDYALARHGAAVMDVLAETVDAYTALQAAIWAEDKVQRVAERKTTLQEVARCPN